MSVKYISTIKVLQANSKCSFKKRKNGVYFFFKIFLIKVVIHSKAQLEGRIYNVSN